MKRSEKLINKLIAEVLNEYVILEKEGEEAAPANPFAAAASASDAAEEGGGEEAAGEEAGGEATAAGGDEKKDDKKKAEPEKGLTFNFDVSAVKKYNTAGFRNSSATAKKITKNGILATVQPDGVDILVGFDDITESVRQFFKTKNK